MSGLRAASEARIAAFHAAQGTARPTSSEADVSPVAVVECGPSRVIVETSSRSPDGPVFARLRFEGPGNEVLLSASPLAVLVGKLSSLRKELARRQGGPR